MARSVEAAPLDRRVRMPRGASIVLTVPADKDYVVIVRSAVAQLGACLGYTVKEITDLRLAVNEACALLVAAGPGPEGTIECRARLQGDTLRVTLTAPFGAFDAAPDPDGLGWTMMTALVDGVGWAQDGVTARVDLRKKRLLPAA